MEEQFGACASLKEWQGYKSAKSSEQNDNKMNNLDDVILRQSVGLSTGLWTISTMESTEDKLKLGILSFLQLAVRN